MTRDYSSDRGPKSRRVTGIPSPTDVAPAELRLRRVNWSKVRRVEWLWNARIPIGKLSLLVGEEGAGKGTLEAWLVAQAIRGRLDGDRKGRPIPVLIVGDEDGFEDTWVPRLLAAGATRGQIDMHVWTLDHEQALNAEEHDELLSSTIQSKRIGWVIFDQLLDHLDGGADGSGVYNPKRVRQALRPIRDVARRADVAVTGNLHPIKGNPKTFRELIGGSHQFNAVSRSSLWLGADPDGADVDRVLIRGKGNLSAEPPSFEFTIAPTTVEINGERHEQPHVIDPREGTRRRSDFEGKGSRGFGRSASVPAHVERADAVADLMRADIPQKVVQLVERSMFSRNEINATLVYLQSQGRARKSDPDNVQSGWVLIDAEGVDIS